MGVGILCVDCRKCEVTKILKISSFFKHRVFLFLCESIIIVNNDKMLKLRKGKDMKQINRAAAQSTLLAAAILMIGYGAMRGEAATVLSKAIKLCLECVGIG